MLQTRHPKDKPPHSHPEPLRERFNFEDNIHRGARFGGSLRGSPRRHHGPKSQGDDGINAAATLPRIGREELVSSYPTTTTSTVSATAAFSTKSAIAHTPTPYDTTFGGYKRRRSSLLEEWTTPLNPNVGASANDGTHVAGSSAKSSYESMTTSAVASPVTTPATARGTISKESATGMAPLPAPATVIERSTASTQESDFATPRAVVPVTSIPVLTTSAASRNKAPAATPSASSLTATVPVSSATIATSPVAAIPRGSSNSQPAKDGKSSVLVNSRRNPRSRKPEPTKANDSISAANVRGKKDAGPRTTSTPQASPRRNGLYQAPNGSTMSRIDLDRLSGGVKTVNRDTIYFRISFLEDPWLGLKPIKTACLERW